ncbi:MAG TPA: hypothetical protein PKV16_07630 [Caldisericia bacterium]|nr:hypothetical protein [Caldisericia bacterium]HPF49705.1 hypothetical protein [Caldisericia bacterium]HPI84522.1 hypothetical protein [Caldisericia bacterium]HPQ93637.1 hypothetical protein [Caldisericia bacterium]HRV74799.1 hypothetical protein [Caldisericia bacterium]
MIDKLLLLFALLRKSFNGKTFLKLYGIILIVSFVMTEFIQRLMALMRPNGSFFGVPAYTEWVTSVYPKLINHGFHVFNEPYMQSIGEVAWRKQDFTFLAISSLVQTFLQLSVYILLVGLVAFVIVEQIKNKTEFMEAITSSVKPIFRFTAGMWVTLLTILLAGFIGTIVQTYIATPGFLEAANFFTPWSIAASGAIIFLSYAFIKVAYLPYLRLESTERFIDTIKYSIHITTGNIGFILLVMAPTIALSMGITFFTDNLRFWAIPPIALALLLVAWVDSCVYLVLTGQHQKQTGKIDQKKELLG